MSVQRIDEIISLLESYVLDGLELPHERVMAAVRLLDWAIPDARPPDDGDEALVLADEPTALVFRPKFVS
jgi:hypothetical protein